MSEFTVYWRDGGGLGRVDRIKANCYFVTEYGILIFYSQSGHVTQSFRDWSRVSER